MINKFAMMVANGNCILNCTATGLTGFPVKQLFRCVNFLIATMWGQKKKKLGIRMSCKRYIEIFLAEKYNVLQSTSYLFATF